MHIKITITKEIIQDFWLDRNKPNFDTCANCPVAKELQKALNDPYLRVNGSMAGLKGDYFTMIILPSEIARLVSKIDCGIMPDNLPITFEFDAEIRREQFHA